MYNSKLYKHIVNESENAGGNARSRGYVNLKRNSLPVCPGNNVKYMEIEGTIV